MSELSERSNALTPERLGILLIVSSYLPNVGGLQRVASQLAAELRKRGHAISILAPRYPRSLLGKQVIDGISISRWHFILPRLRDLRDGRVDLFLAGLFYFPFTLIRLITKIARERPDVVNLHFVGDPALFVSLARWLVRFRYVVSLHGDDVEGLTRGTPFDRWIFRTTLTRADWVTACSRYLIDQARAIVPEIEFKSQAVYNGVTVRSHAPAQSESNTLLAVGRLVPKKGFDIFLRAVAILEGERAWVIGDGPERDALERLARALGISDRVKFWGVQSNEEVVRLIADAQLVVLPSRQEPFGMVALEAMVAGKPIVATYVGGLPEILKGGDALLIEPGNPNVLAQAILDARQEIARNPCWGMRNSEIAVRFSVSRMVAEYTQIFLRQAR